MNSLNTQQKAKNTRNSCVLRALPLRAIGSPYQRLAKFRCARTQNFAKRGVALLVVLFVLLAITAIAILAVRSMNSEERASYSYKLGRQGVQASHQAAVVTLGELSKNILLVLASSQQKGLQAGLDAMQDQEASSENLEAAWNARVSTQNYSYDADFFTPYTGLGITPPAPSDSTRVKGDLSRRIAQSAAVGSIEMTELEVAGFSDNVEFCRYFMQLDAAATIGLPPVSQGSFYYASDLDRNSATKRDLATIQMEPISCQ
ncbi:MAG: hypothetical protein WC966_11595 [Bradymonadales bacterium]|jgi:hypothetical protein